MISFEDYKDDKGIIPTSMNFILFLEVVYKSVVESVDY